MACKIVRRGGDQLADLPGQRHGDHVLRHGLLKADPRVIAFRDDVDHSRFADGLYAHLRVADHKVDQQLVQKQGADMVRHVQTQRAGGLPGVAVDLLAGETDLLQGRADTRHVALSGVGERHAAGGAVKEAGIKAALQPGDGVAYRRGGHAQLLRRGAKAAAPHDRHHHFQLCQT